ncbi:preferentially expressed antigen in melanoma like 5 [Mus musculus]|uniref:PRAME like 5 n=1 Tax=Mus musculus TaxID=10090 RepID=Q7TPY4_MOUSE|nr:preferentially expressed antigen in melanoma like 5 [Mus musculus]AAH52827.2 Pramel5 protein [Mus musculus]|eukprot:NP_001078887.1 preferentially expressed antigen in melanoma like 5 [Mus musculus]
MSFKDPPTLQQLARRSLLKDEALTISALLNLPVQLFPPLFKDAFTSRQRKILSLMVAAWPFPVLPVGALGGIDHLETLKAVLDGLDLLMSQKDRPSRWNLQVLDLGNAHQDFWDGWAGLLHEVCSQDVFGKNQPVGNHPIPGGKQTITIKMNLSLKYCRHSKYLNYLHWWAEQRKDGIQVICEKLEFTGPHCPELRFLKFSFVASIQELAIKSIHWDIYNLALIASCLGQMKNLQKLILMNIRRPPDLADLQEAHIVTEIFSEFSKLHKVHYLHVNNVYFLKERLDQMLRCFERPLETLAITHCRLSELDMRYLSQCPSIHQLKYLDMSYTTFKPSSHRFLGSLLERLTATLQTLKLECFHLTDFQIRDLLPGLSQCSQLTEVDIAMNEFSVVSLKKLLKHTANLTQLTLEKYPAPVEVYDDGHSVISDRFVQLCSELMNTLKGVRQAKQVYFVSMPCLRNYEFLIYNLKGLDSSEQLRRRGLSWALINGEQVSRDSLQL